MSLFFSRASIPEICQKCDHFAAFAGASAKYLGEREGNLAKKRGDERKSVTHHVTSAYVAEAMS
jgi:hypothetical protein